MIAAVVNTSPVKAVYERAWPLAYAIEAELRARGLLADDHASHQHEWRRWDSFGDFGWECNGCGMHVDENPTDDASPVAPPG